MFTDTWISAREASPQLFRFLRKVPLHLSCNEQKGMNIDTHTNHNSHTHTQPIYCSLMGKLRSDTGYDVDDVFPPLQGFGTAGNIL